MSLPDPAFQPEFYADVPMKRVLAWAVDAVLILILTGIVLALTLFIGVLILPVIYFAVSVAYRTVTLTRFGATPGMMLVALKLRGLDGSRPDQRVALGHSLIHSLAMIFVVPQIVSVAMILLTPYKQGLHDWIMGTTVLNKARFG
jgi:uncharacterized RDD family membrane protein YckC